MESGPQADIRILTNAKQGNTLAKCQIRLVIPFLFVIPAKAGIHLENGSAADGFPCSFYAYLPRIPSLFLPQYHILP